MSRDVYVSFLPALIDTSRLTGGMAVVIDVLRASTTASAALTAGVKRLIPFASIDDTRRFAERLAKSGETPLLGGERGGSKIDGFDLGNSPLEYTAETVGGRTILFTTTNGTRALLGVGNADWVAMGCFTNLSAIADRLAEGSGNIHLVCAGTNGQVTLEDVLAAGAIATAVRDRSAGIEWGNDETAIAIGLHDCHTGPDSRLAALRSSRGGRNLIEAGRDADIPICAEENRYAAIPLLENGSLVLETPELPATEDEDWSI